MATDEERLEQIQEWWKEYRWTIIGGTLMGVVAIGGWTGWTEFNKSKQEVASVLYQQVSVAVVEQDYDSAKQYADQLFEEHASSAYAGQAHLLLARASYENGELDVARTLLEKAIDSASESSTVHTARIRLAQLMIAEEQYDGAVALLNVGSMEGFESHYQELKGDAYRQLEQYEQAREAYQASIESLNPNSQYSYVLNLKLNDTPAQN